MQFIIFIAPSKTFSHSSKGGTTTPIFNVKTKQLKDQLLTFTKSQLRTKMKISDQLSDAVYNFFREEQSVKAINLYSGVSYKAMGSESLNVNNGQLYIIDAFYGLIRPEDNISRYRLDFTMRFLGNLYDYWRDDIASYLHQAHKNDVLIDLCSSEFSLLLPKNLSVIRINFSLVNRKISNVLLKQMRGKMAQYIILNNLNNVNSLKEIIIDGFSFSASDSDDFNFIFSRKV